MIKNSLILPPLTIGSAPPAVSGHGAAYAAVLTRGHWPLLRSFSACFSEEYLALASAQQRLERATNGDPSCCDTRAVEERLPLTH